MLLTVLLDDRNEEMETSLRLELEVKTSFFSVGETRGEKSNIGINKVGKRTGLIKLKRCIISLTKIVVPFA